MNKWNDERGLTTIEYVLIGLGIALILGGVWYFYQKSPQELFCMGAKRVEILFKMSGPCGGYNTEMNTAYPMVN